MIKAALAISALFLFSLHASGASVRDLINQNIQRSDTAYISVASVAEPNTSSVQVWVHIQNDSQKNLARELVENLQKSGSWNIETKPIQKVARGPRKSQLRYFKKQDQQQAQELLVTLRTMIPAIELSDLSGKFDNTDWVKPGHYELWLSPEVIRLRDQR